MEKEVNLEESRERAQAVYSELIPYAMEILDVMRKAKIEEGQILDINVDTDGYIMLRLPSLNFHVFRFKNDDFTLACDYTVDLSKVPSPSTGTVAEDV